MSIYTGKSALLSLPIADVYARVANIGAFQQKLESLPAEAREKLGDVKFTDDSIVINTPPVGEIKFRVTERQEPTLVKLQAEQSPVPFAIGIHLEEKSADQTEVIPKIDVDIPPMLRPLVGGKLQEAADKFGDLLQTFVAR